MKVENILILAAIIMISVHVYSQSGPEDISPDQFEKATYLKGDLETLLVETTEYPEGALKARVDGDVILRARINKLGKLDSITVISTPDASLSKSAYEALQALSNPWRPTFVNKRAIDKEYLVGFRFRIYPDGNPPKYKSHIDRFVKKNKFSKVLKFCNDAILDNPYDFDTYKTRALSKEKLGDIAGSAEDTRTYRKLYQEVLSTIDIFSKGHTKFIKVATESTYH
jgi:TonB family protein